MKHRTKEKEIHAAVPLLPEDDPASYRRARSVTQVMVFTSLSYGETAYPVCPRCSMTLEREFMVYCDRCGQKLDWRELKRAARIFPHSHGS